MGEGDEVKKKRRPFKIYTYRGVELDNLLDMPDVKLAELMPCRQRRKINRGLKPKHQRFLKRLRKSKKNCGHLEKPKCVKTHLRDMIVLPEMVGSIVGVHNGKQYAEIEIRPDMISHYLGEFSMSYKPVKHGRPGIGATHSSRFIPLK